MRPEKLAIQEEVRANLEGSDFALLGDYRGLSVAKTTELRGLLREAGSRYQVVKNTAFGRAAADLGMTVDAVALSGPTAAITGRGDVTAVVKLLKKFIKANERPVLKGGILAGRAITADDIELMAQLPGREEMLGRFVGTVAAPMSGLVGVMNQKLCSLVYALKAAVDKKSAA